MKTQYTSYLISRILREAPVTFSVCLMLAMLPACHKKDKSASEEIPQVDVAVPLVDSIVLHKSYPGVIASSDKAEVVGRVNGLILSRNFQEGSRVTKGQVLFVIESSKYSDAVQQAEAALNTARSEYEYASHQYEAMNKAIRSDAVSQMDVIQAKSRRDQAQSAINTATAQLRTARTNLGYCRVTAPISGTISAAKLDVGAYVGGEGAPVALATIYDEKNLTANFHIEDARYEEMVGRNGGLANPLLRAVPLTFTNTMPHAFTADITYESPAVDPSTGTLLVKGKVDNSDYELKDGMYCTVHLPYGTDPRALLIKDASIGTDQLGKYVYVVNPDGTVVYTPITVGDLYQDSLRIVEKGLKPGQQYVTKALLNVRDGEKVKPRLTH